MRPGGYTVTKDAREAIFICLLPAPSLAKRYSSVNRRHLAAAPRGRTSPQQDAYTHGSANLLPGAIGRPQPSEPDWLETEVIAGFRVWQILFLVCAGLCTLVVVACCVTRWRIPHTRQEIEANHRRNQITQLFRCHLDRITVDEVDLSWALDTVKEAVERRKSRKKASEDAGESEIEIEPKPLSLLERIKNVFVKKPLVEFSDDESNQLSTSTLDNYSL
ncbi:uncharacterized protein CDAR_450321 [Caerostris darwini]|uniref:Transmembrane inner ear expressed protein n=1 Tax=Caerostris darwini TaxID=1538125 RepID=A0AAV4NDJ1_9ARAC|nr:uncharacterized protein CDAR_450321 [Caerostris darwini]